jgi:hypothetical protein
MPWSTLRNVSIRLPRNHWAIFGNPPSSIDPSRLRVQKLRVEVRQKKQRSKGSPTWNFSISGLCHLDHLRRDFESSIESSICLSPYIKFKNFALSVALKRI